MSALSTAAHNVECEDAGCAARRGFEIGHAAQRHLIEPDHNVATAQAHTPGHAEPSNQQVRASIKADEQKELAALLDEAFLLTYPASDPISINCRCSEASCMSPRRATWQSAALSPCGR